MVTKMDPVEAAVGVKLTHLLAGVAGGTVRAFLSGEGFLASFSSVVVGSLTAGYLTTPVYAGVRSYVELPADPSSEHAIGFLVGLTAMLICEGVLRAVRGWANKPNFPKSKGDA